MSFQVLKKAGNFEVKSGASEKNIIDKLNG